jgi:hypothetical protein
MGRYASSFDGALLSTEDAGFAAVEAAAIERMAATVEGLAAARAADGGAWKQAGERSAAHRLARSTGTSVGQASETLETARRLATLPAVDAAARSGALSAQQAAAVRVRPARPVVLPSPRSQEPGWLAAGGGAGQTGLRPTR